MSESICTELDCAGQVHGRGLCSKHYARLQRRGAFPPPHRQEPVCIVDGCETRSASAGHCSKHYARKQRNGDVAVVKGGPEGIEDRHHNWTGDRATYRAAHKRLTRHRGAASTHPCADCGQPARHWSYDHADENELIAPAGYPYSTDPAHYAPRCSSCHKLFDKGPRDTCELSDPNGKMSA